MLKRKYGLPNLFHYKILCYGTFLRTRVISEETLASSNIGTDRTRPEYLLRVIVAMLNTVSGLV